MNITEMSADDFILEATELMENAAHKKEQYDEWLAIQEKLSEMQTDNVAEWLCNFAKTQRAQAVAAAWKDIRGKYNELYGDQCHNKASFRMLHNYFNHGTLEVSQKEEIE